MRVASCIVLTADEDFANRMDRLCRDQAALSVVCVSDPATMDAMAMVAQDGADHGSSRDVAGIIVDLTFPRHTRVDPLANQSPKPWNMAEAFSIWCITAVIAATRTANNVPILVVSSISCLRETLFRAGISIAGQMMPEASDAAWYVAIHRLVSNPHELPEVARSGSQRDAPPLLHSPAVQLSPNIWFYADGAVLYREERPIPLTAREATLLARLLQTPGHYLTAAQLAHGLTRSDAAYPVDEHCVEQAICTLRHKLGESARRPRILFNKRGLGYTLRTCSVEVVGAPSPSGHRSSENLNET